MVASLTARALQTSALARIRTGLLGYGYVHPHLTREIKKPDEWSFVFAGLWGRSRAQFFAAGAMYFFSFSSYVQSRYFAEILWESLNEFSS